MGGRSVKSLGGGVNREDPCCTKLLQAATCAGQPYQVDYAQYCQCDVPGQGQIHTVRGLIDRSLHLRIRIILGTARVVLLVFLVIVSGMTLAIADCTQTREVKRNSLIFKKEPNLRFFSR